MKVMNYFLETSLCAMAVMLPSFVSAQATTDAQVNHVTTYTPQTAGVGDVATISGQPIEVVNVSVHYFDGLGRPIQLVEKQASPQHFDMVTPMEYDEFGRESRKFLPYVGENSADGYYKLNALRSTNEGSKDQKYRSGEQFQFYQSGGSLAQDERPFADVIFEPSPMNRITKQGAAGQSWQPDQNNFSSLSDKTIKRHYLNNGSEEILLFTYDQISDGLSVWSGSSLEFYGANELYATVTYDENANEVIEYVDKDQRVICKQVQYGVDGTTKMYAKTYYIYDNSGKLVVVLPPEAIVEILKQY